MTIDDGSRSQNVWAIHMWNEKYVVMLSIMIKKEKVKKIEEHQGVAFA
jgi:hypothetical protein